MSATTISIVCGMTDMGYSLGRTVSKLPSGSQAPGKPGRPRSAPTRDRIPQTAFDLLAETGHDALTIEAVAARSGTGESTIYRWWQGKADLAVAAFLHGTEARLYFPGGPRSRDDFAEQIGELGGLLREWRGAVLAAMLAAGQLRPGVQPAAALALLYSPLYPPLLFGQLVPPPDRLDAILTLALDAIFA